MYKITVDHKKEIIFYTHSGTIPRKEIGEAWAELLLMDEFVKLKYNLLSDYRNSLFDFEVDDTDMVWDYFYSIREILKGKKEAVITDNPLTTAISSLFENDSCVKIGFEVKVFTTEKSAIKWLEKG